MDINDQAPDHQMAIQELHYAFVAHDQARLTGLTEDQLDAHARARRALFDYVDDLWQDAKRQGLNPALRPEWKAVAAMRDLTLGLQTTVAAKINRRDTAEHE